MSLIKSISGIRGTIGGKPGDNLTPVDIVECTAGYATFLKRKGVAHKVAVGRDARISGEMVQGLVINTLIACGIDVVDMGLSTTPTVEMNVVFSQSGGGIVITASHNPIEWNALKFLNEAGEFISAEEGQQILSLIKSADFDFVPVMQMGKVVKDTEALDKHIESILKLPYIKTELIKKVGFKVAVDPVNSTGGMAIKRLLEKLGCTYISINDDCSGHFAHNPEPLPEHLKDLCNLVTTHNAHIGVSVDPDVDRLALIDEKGHVFGEEYTLVAVSDYILDFKPGNTVSNLSSTRALKDVTVMKGHQYNAAAVGEVNVVEKMKATNAVIGGEGNGGVILPDLHYGRDALVGVALILSLMAERNISLSALKETYPVYQMSKDKITLTPSINVDQLLSSVAEYFSGEEINQLDGVKIDFEEGWVHLRKSNTEPIIRIYAEAKDDLTLQSLTERIKQVVNQNI